MKAQVVTTRSHFPDEDDVEDEGSVTRIIRRMKSGDQDQDGADLIWDRFFLRLKYLVKERLNSRPRTVSDEEDLALESLAELFQGLRDGKYPALDNRESVWRLLVKVATDNVMDEIIKESRQKRGSGRVVNESALTKGSENPSAGLDQFQSGAQAPDVKIMIAERVTLMLESLGDKTLRSIAVMKVANNTNEEVAKALKISVRSVERRLQEIRECWKKA